MERCEHGARAHCTAQVCEKVCESREAGGADMACVQTWRVGVCVPRVLTFRGVPPWFLGDPDPPWQSPRVR